MFKKISNAAEKLATNVSESRRGFLVRVGQTALGVASVVSGLLVLPNQAQAIVNINRGCHMNYFGRLDGICIDKSSGNCKYCYGCPYGIGGGFSQLYLCGYRISTRWTCRCP
jgi:hypothetical protein